MKKELDNSLLEQFPTLFGSMFRHEFECSSGWYDLIVQMAKELVALPNGDQIKVDQLKEKFAQLTVYVDKSTPEISEILHKYYTFSKYICEICGTAREVKIRTNEHWIRTLCPECDKKRVADPKFGGHQPPTPEEL
jgi:hypothetical protein